MCYFPSSTGRPRDVRLHPIYVQMSDVRFGRTWNVRWTWISDILWTTVFFVPSTYVGLEFRTSYGQPFFSSKGRRWDLIFGRAKYVYVLSLIAITRMCVGLMRQKWCTPNLGIPNNCHTWSKSEWPSKRLGWTILTGAAPNLQYLKMTYPNLI